MSTLIVHKELEYLELLNLKKKKRSDERLEEKKKCSFQDFNWHELYTSKSISKQTVQVLNLYITKKKLNTGSSKKEKVAIVEANIAKDNVSAFNH